MKRFKTVRVLPSLAALALVFAVGCAERPEQTAETSETAAAEAQSALKAAPEFTLPDTHGNEVSLADFRGSWVILEWINHGCPFVVKHYAPGNMQRLQAEYTGRGAIWLSICSSAPGTQGHETPERWNELNAEKGAVPTAVLLDTDGLVGRAYGATRTPEMVVIDPQGRIVYQGAIDDNPSRHSADIEGAENYLETVMEAVLAGQPSPIDSTKPYGCTVKYAD